MVAGSLLMLLWLTFFTDATADVRTEDSNPDFEIGVLWQPDEQGNMNAYCHSSGAFVRGVKTDGKGNYWIYDGDKCLGYYIDEISAEKAVEKMAVSYCRAQ